MKTLEKDKIRQSVRESYEKVAVADTSSSCCEPSAGCCDSQISIAEQASGAMGYSKDDLSSLPKGANMGLGCGNPIAIASLKPGETVVDLGSGGGIDVFLAAKAVGPTGRAIGIDMTPVMISKARSNADKAGVTNVEFRLSEIENLPIADNSVDVIISNCVINLSPAKQQVYNDVFRALKSGGRLAISDVVTRGEIPEAIRDNPAYYAGCISGASSVEELQAMLETAGFKNISIKPKNESREMIAEWRKKSNSEIKFEDLIFSAYIEAIKP